MQIENVVLSNLISNEEYVRQVLPHLEPEYFHDAAARLLFKIVNSYIGKYNKNPSREALYVILSKPKVCRNESEKKAAEELVAAIPDVITSQQWLVDETEKWCRQQALHNALLEGIEIFENRDDPKSKKDIGAIPELLTDAIAVSFDNRVGHDFLEDFKERFEFYHTKEKRVPFGLTFFNKITGGGLPNKSLFVIMASTGGGKSLSMCSMAADNIRAGQNVLYLTLELSEERVAERIDTNLLDVPIGDLKGLPRDAYEGRMKKLREAVKGRLIIKEFPTASANANHFRHVLHELKIKKNFKPDIIYVDYLNICASSRLRASQISDTYTYVKAIAEELRGLAVENDLPIVTATQTNRAGFTSSDVGLENTSESWGLPATADIMVALYQSEELEALNQILVKQLKNRFGDPAYYRRFVLGIEKRKFKLFDIAEEATEELVQPEEANVKDYTDRNKSVDRTVFDNWDYSD